MDIYEQIIKKYQSKNFIVYKLKFKNEIVILFHRDMCNTFIYGIIKPLNLNELDIGYLAYDVSKCSLGCSDMISLENKSSVYEIDKKIEKIEKELIKTINIDYFDIEMCPKVVFENPKEAVKQFALENGYNLIIS